MIVDSNLIILSATPAYPGLRQLILNGPTIVSAVSRIEVLGYHKLPPDDRQFFESFFSIVAVRDITSAVIEQAVLFRQGRKMSVGDAIIAATARIENDTLYTHNLKDFTWIPGLTVIDPIAGGDAPSTTKP